MIIESISHRGLSQLIENNNSQLIRPNLVRRVLRVVTALAEAQDISSFIEGTPRGWRVHRLSRNRSNEWSVSVSGNWRITFEEEDGCVNRLNLEDYH